MGRAEAGVALSIKRRGIDRRNLLAEREAYLASLSRVYEAYIGIMSKS